MATDTKKQKSAGRPDGSKNVERAEVSVCRVADPCPNCHEPVVLNNRRKVREGEASGEHRGMPYSYYRLFVGSCSCCGRAIKQFEYDYIPTEEIEVRIDAATGLDT